MFLIGHIYALYGMYHVQEIWLVDLIADSTNTKPFLTPVVYIS